MSYTLKTDELLEALQQDGDPTAPAFQKALEGLADAMAQRLADRHQVGVGEASFEGVAFAGTACTFHPAYRGQPVPDAMRGFDNLEEWQPFAEGLREPVAGDPVWSPKELEQQQRSESHRF